LMYELKGYLKVSGSLSVFVIITSSVRYKP